MFTFLLATALGAPGAQAGIAYLGGIGATSYGVTDYGGLQGLPLGSFQIGGGNALGDFGAGSTYISGPGIAFNLSDSGAALRFGPGDTSFRAISIDLLPSNLVAGTTINVISTLTELADPASIFDFNPASDPALLLATGVGLPDFSLANSTPEPSSLALLAASLAALALLMRQRQVRAG